MILFFKAIPWKKLLSDAARELSAPNDYSLMAKLLLYFIRYYREQVSKFTGDVCIYQPTCSRYSMSAIQRYGAIKGWTLTMRRLWRCRPPYPGGYDPIP
jgi:putative membrane protein insertion efficiency factor